MIYKKIIKISLLSLLINSSFTQAETLQDIGKIAMKNDLKLVQLSNNLESNIQKNNEIEGLFKPTVSLDGSTNYTLIDNNNNRNYNNSTDGSLGLTLNYKLYDSSKVALKDNQYIDNVSTFFDLESYRQEVMFKTTELYYNILSNRKILETDKERYISVEKNYKQVKQMVDVGFKTNVELFEVQAELDQVEADILDSENNLQNTLSQLYVFTEKYDLTPDEIAFKTKRKDYESLGYDHWFKILEENNISIKKAKLEKDIAQNKIKIESAENDLKVYLNSGVKSTYNNRSNDDFDNSVNIGVSVTMPIFDGGVSNSRVKQAQIAYTNSSVNLDYTYRQLKPQLKIIINELESKNREIQALERSVFSSKKSFESIKYSYEVGVRTIVDVLDANSLYYVSLKNLANAEYDYLIKQNELLYVSGVLDLDNI